MSARTLIDSVEFARAGEELSGSVAVAELARLADSLFDTDGTLTFDLKGGCDARQRLRLKLCLGKLVYGVSTTTSLLVLTDEAAVDEGEIEDLDGVPAAKDIDVGSLVEDEVLLALPLAPRHAEGECNPAVKGAGNPVASPFAALARLKQDRNSRNRR